MNDLDHTPEQPKKKPSNNLDDVHTAPYADYAARILDGIAANSSEGLTLSPERFSQKEATEQLRRFIDQFEPDPNEEDSFFDMSLYEVVYDDQLQSYVILYDSAPFPTLMLENGNYPELFIPPAMLSLEALSVRSCNIERLIGLPRSLTSLYCSDNKLTQLPKLPPHLEVLFCDANQLTTLPEIPQTLKDINFSNNPLDKQTIDILKQRGFLQ